MLLGDSIIHGVRIAELERQTGSFLHAPGKSGTKGAKTDRCYTVRDAERFPGSNFCQVLPRVLRESKVDNLVLQTPSYDITNLHDEIANLNPEECRIKLQDSSKVMAYLADRAVKEYPQIKR